MPFPYPAFYRQLTAMALALLIAGCAATRTGMPPTQVPEPPAMVNEPAAAPVVTKPAPPAAATAVATSVPEPVRLRTTPELTMTPPAPKIPAEVTAPQPAAAADTTKKAEPPKPDKPAVTKTGETVIKPPPTVAPPLSPPPLALAALEQRLKETPAIGVFTKLTLKNQVDELLERFRAHYAGQGGATLSQLRKAYDQLLQKVHGLLKDGDPALASAIANSREAIWSVLTDPVKFAKL